MGLRLVVDNELPERDALALGLVEAVTRLRLGTANLRGPGRAELDADVQLLRTVAVRIAFRVCNWRQR